MGLGSWLLSGQPLDVAFCPCFGRRGIALVLCAELPQLGIRWPLSYPVQRLVGSSGLQQLLLCSNTCGPFWLSREATAIDTVALGGGGGDGGVKVLSCFDFDNSQSPVH